MQDFSNHPSWIAYTKTCEELSRIEKKLKNPNLPEAKKDKLLYRLSDLKDRIIPRMVQNISMAA